MQRNDELRRSRSLDLETLGNTRSDGNQIDTTKATPSYIQRAANPLARLLSTSHSRRPSWLVSSSLAFALFATATLPASLTAVCHAAEPSATASTSIETTPKDDSVTPGVSTARLEQIFSGETPSSVNELQAMESHFKELAKKITPAVVGVRVGQSQGSGVIISRDGYVLTAGHVVGKSNQKAVFIMPDGKEVEGTTLGANFGIDSGLMKITEDGTWPYLDMGDSELLNDGQWVMAAGHPGGYEVGRSPVIRIGRILSKNNNNLKTDCVLVGGDSGGPLFDMEGRVVGINSRIGSKLTANIHVPINTYSETWDRLAAAEEWGNFGIGERILNMPYIGVERDPESEAAKIKKVQDDGPAAKAGLLAGDTIVQFDGESIASFGALIEAVNTKKPGDEVDLVVERNDAEVKLTLTVGNRRQ